mmetsp:Transcript_64991/g.89304  ORF Transcript_64991/g.89304 Transcript_64991/m.89304 type:complete len:149 (-) Transcript_64991:55-501(-)
MWQQSPPSRSYAAANSDRKGVWTMTDEDEPAGGWNELGSMSSGRGKIEGERLCSDHAFNPLPGLVEIVNDVAEMLHVKVCLVTYYFRHVDHCCHKKEDNRKQDECSQKDDDSPLERVAKDGLLRPRHVPKPSIMSSFFDLIARSWIQC